MKRLALLSACLPGMAFAHGGHVPIEEIVPGLAPTTPLFILGVATLVAGCLFTLWSVWQ